MKLFNKAIELAGDPLIAIFIISVFYGFLSLFSDSDISSIFFRASASASFIVFLATAAIVKAIKESKGVK